MSVTDNKITVQCYQSHCKYPMRIPADKHIVATCPLCGIKQEFDNGVPVVDKTPKATGDFTEPIDRVATLIAAIVIGLSVCYFIVHSNTHSYAETSDSKQHSETIFASAPGYIALQAAATPAEDAHRIDGPYKSISYNREIYNDNKDTSSTSKLRETLEKIKDALDLGKDIAEIVAEMNGEELGNMADFAEQYEYKKHGYTGPFADDSGYESHASKQQRVKRLIKELVDCGCIFHM